MKIKYQLLLTENLSKMKKQLIILAILAGLFLASCDKMLLPDETPNNPVSNFDDLWNAYDQMYGGFIVKNIDWDSVYTVYRPQINENSSDEDLYLVLTQMLDILYDNHVYLMPANCNLGMYQSGILGDLKTCNDFSVSAVKDNYLSDEKVLEDAIFYGKLSDDIGYIYIGSMGKSEKYYINAMDEIINSLSDTKAIVVDIRSNEGGMDQNSVFIAGYFANQEKVAFSFKLRNGPEHDDFTPSANYYVKPEGSSQYLKPVILLTNRFSVSAAETFTFAMSELENVTIVGDTTSGAFSDVISRELPNGWIYGVSVGDWRNANGVSYEGIGFPPDVIVKNDSADVAAGIDKALEKAIEIIN
jgi:hypothetical protein